MYVYIGHVLLVVLFSDSGELWGLSCQPGWPESENIGFIGFFGTVTGIWKKICGNIEIFGTVQYFR